MTVEMTEGATVAVGFTETINCGPANEWVELVCYYLCQGYTVEGAVNEVNEMAYFRETPLADVVIAGNKHYRLGE